MWLLSASHAAGQGQAESKAGKFRATALCGEGEGWEGGRRGHCLQHFGHGGQKTGLCVVQQGSVRLSVTCKQG